MRIFDRNATKLLFDDGLGRSQLRFRGDYMSRSWRIWTGTAGPGISVSIRRISPGHSGLLEGMPADAVYYMHLPFFHEGSLKEPLPKNSH